MNPLKRISRNLTVALTLGMLLLLISGCPSPQTENLTGSAEKGNDSATTPETKLSPSANVDTGVEGHIFTFPKETDPEAPDIQEEPDILPGAEEELKDKGMDPTTDSN